MVTELVEGGDLFSEIERRKNLSEKLAANIMKQLLSAILYCHKRGIVHRDLKPENILIEKSKDSSELNIKVIDFGTANIFKKNTRLNEALGTLNYMAPEVLDSNYNQKCDVWSCGVILYILLCGYFPFDGDTDNEIMASVKKGKYDLSGFFYFNLIDPIWNNISDDAKDLLSNMLVLSDEKRFSAEQAYSHKWIQNAATTPVNIKAMGEALNNLKNFRVFVLI